MMRTLTWSATATAAAALFLLAGCGGGEQSATSKTATTVAGAPAKWSRWFASGRSGKPASTTRRRSWPRVGTGRAAAAPVPGVSTSASASPREPVQLTVFWSSV